MNTENKIKHLFWRSGFGQTPKEWKASKNQSLQQNIDHIFASAKSAPALPSAELYQQYLLRKKKPTSEERKKLRKQSKRLIAKQISDWMNRMSDPKQSAFLERMCLFWHGHFACVSKNARPAYYQLASIRQHALGNFRDLVLAIAKDPSMIRFLNNQQNRKNSPNENFARELMELFTIGRGHYSEQDIKEAARAFTGWSSNLKGEFVFKNRQHDFGQKQFMGQRGNFDGDEIIDIILSKKQTATFIATKVYRYFVNEKINARHIETLSTILYDSKYDIETLMRAIFESDWFYDLENIGIKIKSPVELIAGMMRQLNVNFNKPESTVFIQKALGQVLFNPPNVAGWPGGKSWIDNSTLMLRLNLINYLFLASDIKFKVKEEFEAQKRNKAVKKIEASVDTQAVVSTFKKYTDEAIFEQLSTFLLQTNQPHDKSLFTKYIYQNNKEDYIKSMMIRIMGLPEYQMC